MAKSIEQIWKEGFVDEKALIAPLVNDLYNQKSKNVVDKLEHMFELNHKGVLIGAAVFFTVLTFLGAPIFGLYVASLFVLLVFVGRLQLKQLQKIDKGMGSYQYLTEFNNWFEQSCRQYEHIYRIFYPLLFVSCVVRFGYSENGTKILEKVSEIQPGELIIWGVPWIIWVVVFVITTALTLGGAKIYRADVNIVYGRQMAKLREIIKDMETLRHN